ncbi:MAG: ArsC family transcriptional regulator [Hyphomonas sp.]|uniref:ArsC/Spx/MgsR family protein n=1 Tax=Hyphomonas sp. TaxID=87 RepID=UPI001809E655|nr:ArsC/Spx/MgsR family protein [Hyphomonas sp.]MBU3921902.1 ArsC family transcriptional regulator [Alphaproteobacteria bacterium]MBA3070388.1 ArsC family transcriptional regulator [Hyphomonas sp.]MBU4062875.1 ArsC family transcriptional regulator [Alphaproteobacteria bacterium]MBU4163794.1 ArsC family transcriptional regulator [Alphaproteobacteria bacterium]MBU4569316.1 ArsC family transcriptional regulator [Alphaproteobacteria bacterium]
MSTKLFGLKNCDTCKKALKDLEASGAAPEFVDIRAEADLKTLLPRWIAAAGEKLINRSSATWRALSDADKARATGASLEGLLLGHPTLIKRPVIETGGDILIGWTAETKARIG